MSGARTRTLVTLLAGLMLGVVLTVVSLAQAGRLAPERPATLVALGQMLETEHRRVDLLLSRGKVAEAIQVLEALREHPWPTRADGGDDAVMMRHDVYGRLVRLRIDHPDVDRKAPEELLALCDEGLAEAYREVDVNPFTSRLVALRGEVLEQLERDDDALTAYEEALDMNRELLDRELGAGP